MYDANKQSKNGIVVSYKHIVPETIQYAVSNSCKAVQEQSDCSGR